MILPLLSRCVSCAAEYAGDAIDIVVFAENGQAIAAQAAGFLNQAGLLPALGYGVWNTSHILSQHSIVGQLLHILVGYIARPSGIEIVFYVGTFLTIFTLMHLRGGRSMAPAKQSADSRV